MVEAVEAVEAVDTVDAVDPVDALDPVAAVDPVVGGTMHLWLMQSSPLGHSALVQQAQHWPSRQLEIYHKLFHHNSTEAGSSPSTK